MSSGKSVTVEAVTLKIVDLVDAHYCHALKGPTQPDTSFGSCERPSVEISCAGLTPATEDMHLIIQFSLDNQVLLARLASGC